MKYDDRLKRFKVKDWDFRHFDEKTKNHNFWAI
jgi:hypothetical protein